MILAFNPRFIDPILTGTKIHTIRENKSDRWEPGMKIQMATGVRTKNYNCFTDQFTCVSTQRIFMTLTHILEVTIDFDNYLYHWDKVKLIANDGLSYNEFVDWFFPKGEGEFSGTIIHWTNFRY